VSSGITSLQSPIGRRVSIAFGTLLLVVGLPFLVLGTVGVFRIESAEPPIVVVVVASMAVGVFTSLTGLRMILGLKRRDGGLFSPFVLRIAGLVFAVTPLILLFTVGRADWRSLWLVIELGFYFAVAGACFAIASRRESPVLSGPTLPEDS
jgi:hypothetical protein